MTLQEYVISLQNQNLSQEEIYTKVEEWKKNNPQPQVEEEVEEVVEEKPIPLTIASATEPIEPEYPSKTVNDILKEKIKPQSNVEKNLRLASGDFYNESKNISQQIADVKKALSKTKSIMDPDNAVLQNELDRLNTLLKPTIEKEKEKELEYYTKGEGVSEQISKKTQSTLRSISSGLLRLPTFLNEKKATMLLTDEELEKINQLNPNARAAVLAGGGNWGAFSNYLLKMRNEAEKQIDEIDSSIYKFETGISDSFVDGWEELKKGNFGEAGKKALQATSQAYQEAIPSLLYMAQATTPYVGLVSLFAGTAASESGAKQDEAYEAKRLLDQLSVQDPDYDTKKAELQKIIEKGDISGKLMLHSNLVGGFEATLDRFSAGLGKSMFKNLFGVSKNIADKSLKQWGVEIIKGFGGEGLTEAATSVLQDASEFLVLGDENAFVGKLKEYIDTFIIGGVSGKTVTTAGAVPNIISRGVNNSRINSILKETDYKTLGETFSISEVTPQSIELTQIPIVQQRLNDQVDKQVSQGEITVEKADEIKKNYIDTQSAVDKLKPVNLSDNTEAVSLVKEKNKLNNVVKQVNDSALTQEETVRVNEINTRLSELAADAKIEKANVVGMSILPTRKSLPKADELATQYQQDPSAVDVEALLDQYNKIGLAAIKFDTRKGDMAREDAVAEINKEFAGIMNRWSPDKGSFSTFVTANIAPKAQSIYDKYIGQKDATTLDRPEAREVVAEEVEVDVTPQETGRAKVYPATLEVVTENITPEVRSEQTVMVKDDINRAVATVSTSPKVVAKNLVDQIKTKEYRQLLKNKLGKWNSDQYNNNVDRLITKDFIATIPVAQLKRRFPRLFEIEVIDRVPTVKIEDGKRTDFKKPVYKIPAITDAKLETIKEYFKDNEKRHQSLMEVLGEGIAIEQMQELKGDQAFVTDLQGRLELKGSDLTAEQFLDEVEFNLDKRNLEDKSLDVVEGTVDSVVNEMITEDSVNDIQVDVLSEAISKLETFRKTNLSMNALAGVVEAGLRTLRAARNAGRSLASAIKDFTKSIKDFIKKPAVKKSTPKKPTSKKPDVKKSLTEKDINVLKELAVAKNINEAIKLSGIEGKVTINDNNRAEKIKQMEKAIIDASIPSWMFESSKFGNFARRKVDGKYVNLPARGGLYYGKSDPAYKKALQLATKNDDKYKIKPPKRVSVKKAFTNKGVKQSEENIKALEFVANKLTNAVEKKQMSAEIAALFISSGYQATTGLIKISAPFKYKSKKFEHAKTGKPSQRTGEKFREEHNPPASVIGANLIYGIANNKMSPIIKAIKNNYYQTQLSKKDDTKLDEANLDSILPEGTSILTSNVAAVRLAAAGIDLNSIVNPTNGKTLAEEVGLPIKNKADINLESINYQNKLLVDVAQGDLTIGDAKIRLDKSLPIQNAKAKNSIKFAKNEGSTIVTDNMTSEQQKTVMVNSLETKVQASKITPKQKGISIFDFDDTLANTKEKVIVNMPDGSINEISAAEFAREAGNLTEAGAQFDFSNFENVSSDTAEGPLADLARKRQGKFGSGNIFVLTARPNSAGPAIQQFLKSIGINIPLSNITGLADGSPQAKVDFVLNKTDEGYNDFYFADDSFANVKAVSQILDAVDVKNKVQQAKASKRRNLGKDFNRQLEQVTGKEAFKKYSDARGRLEGQQKDKGTFKRFLKQFTITPSAEDFMGLMYAFMGKGTQGNAHAKFIKENLMDPYNKAEQELISAQVSVANDFAELKKQFPNLKSKRGKNPLLEEIGVGPYTKSQAIRVYMWNKQGMDIPGMSQRDVNDLVKAVEADNELNVFADEVALIQKGEQYPAPTQTWLAGNIASDIMQGLKTGFRKKLMTEFNENADIIFSKENLNKIEAIYGSKFREALEDSLRRMKTGSNRPVFVGGGARIVNEMLDWLNSSVGAVMFFNMRSGLLQLISNVNFINWGDNNIYDAAKAFVSKDYFPTVLKLINSDYLVNRRDGLKINVNEAELTDAGRKGGVKGMINYLLDKGFAITRIMDSVAIATGGATFFINRKKSLQNRVNKDTGKLYTEAQAEQQAFDDFYAIAEETQQSSNPSRISTQQASFAGRIILSFQNVTMQYNRKTKKSIQDLYNRRAKPGMTQRESDLSNLSSIIYYVSVQNLIFNAMQQALFGLAFDDEPDEDEKDKAANIVNGMADSLLFGLGFGGAIISTVKNVLMRIASESEKKTTQYRDVVWNVFDISPVLDSKVRKLRTAFKTFDWNMKEIKKRGWSIDNPAYLAVAQIISATTNLPIDRALQKLNNLRQATDEETKTWQRVALALGWSGWNFGLPYWGRQSTIDKEAKDEEKVKEKFKEDVRKAKTMGFTKRIPFTGPKSGKPNGKLGVDYLAIERYDGLIQYYKKP